MNGRWYPALWNQVRRAVDAASQPGQFLLTGSAVPADDAARHTGAGRFAFLRLRPMTLGESGAATGGVSLAALLEGEPISCADPGLAVADLAELVCRGGWPAQLERPLSAACRAARDDLEQVRQVDVPRVDGRRRDPQRLGALLRPWPAMGPRRCHWPPWPPMRVAPMVPWIRAPWLTICRPWSA